MGTPGQVKFWNGKRRKKSLSRSKRHLLRGSGFLWNFFITGSLIQTRLHGIMNTNKNNVYQMKNLVRKKIQRIMNRFL